MVSLISLATLTMLIAHGVVLIYAFARDRSRRAELLWLTFVILFSAGAATTYLLPPEMLAAGKIGRGFWLILALIGMMGSFGALVIHDMTEPDSRRQLFMGWGLLVGAWLSVLLITTLFSPVVTIGQPNWLISGLRSPDAATLILTAGLVVSSLALLGIGFYLFYQSVLPEVANRALYWVLETAILITGVVLTGSGNDMLAIVGMIALLTVIIGATYAYSHHRVFDIRGGLSRAFTLVLMIAFTTALLFAAMYAVTGLDLNQRAEGLSVIAGLALAFAVLYVPVRQIVETILNRLIEQPPVDPAQATREYSQQVAHAVELDELAQATSLSLNRVMGIRRSGLMLVNGTYDDEMELLMIPGGSFGAETRGKTVSIPLRGSLYQTLARDHQAVSQFDLEYSPRYGDLPQKVRTFFADLRMSAYAPIVMDNVMMGVIVCGPKINDAAYFRSDLELLTTLAQQTGFALRNARLVADLQHLNATMRSLNRGLEDANRELARLDAVKTDFVTIASHELRTPLAQIRGYTDIIDTINEQGMLDQEQTTVLVSNLRKATERMEELISAMLDVSQLDVNAMDLRFTQTSTDTVLRMAIEPLTESIKHRKQSLMVRGVKGLPSIQADLQRLVQAFRNVIVNAIKFTPDGGRIEITASLQPAQAKDGVDHILVTIADTGVGIDPAHLELIFKKFYRTYDPQLHSTGTYKFLGAGPGLGLTIAKGVIESHGGRIWAESEGHSVDNPPGATFYILLPTTPPEDARRVVTFETSGAKLPISP
jgi:signal transduction histidine kinase